jgi:hypothetical protein
VITVEATENLTTKEKIFTVRVPYPDLLTIKLDKFDQAVIDSPAETAADILQSLQILAFRQLQQIKPATIKALGGENG